MVKSEPYCVASHDALDPSPWSGHTQRPMSMRLRVAAGLAVAVILAILVIPPVIEEHLEPGFCSADCPVQHAGHGAAVTSPPLASAARRAPVVATAETRAAEADRGTVASPDAPRAPPTA